MRENEVLQPAIEVAEQPMDEAMVKSDYRRSDREVLRDYEIGIKFLSGRGCIINVGCKQIAFEDNQKAMEALNAYVANPYEESQKWNQIFNQ
jgi:hypothetical protein